MEYPINKIETKAVGIILWSFELLVLFELSILPLFVRKNFIRSGKYGVNKIIQAIKSKAE